MIKFGSCSVLHINQEFSPALSPVKTCYCSFCSLGCNCEDTSRKKRSIQIPTHMTCDKEFLSLSTKVIIWAVEYQSVRSTYPMMNENSYRKNVWLARVINKSADITIMLSINAVQFLNILLQKKHQNCKSHPSSVFTQQSMIWCH